MVRVKNRAIGVPEIEVKNGLDSQREAIRRLLIELPAASDRKIARIVDVDPKVVSQVRRELLDSGELHRHEADNAHNATNTGV